MKLFQRIISSKNFWPLIVVLVFGILASRALFSSGYFNMHDDLQMMRQLEMEKCFLDGQIPCRWTPDMAYGHGFAMFNFYPPLPYLVGQGIRALGFSFVSTAKMLFIIAFLASGVAMYFLAKDFFGLFGGVISAIFYIWAPYHAVDIYVRGALNEAWALIWFPAIFWASYKLITEKKNILNWIIGLALFWFSLFTSHNLMVMIFVPAFAIWVLLWLWREKAWQKIPYLILSGIWALGLAAFSTLPAILENGLTQIKSQLVGYYNYTVHFVDINQLLISRFWGYGPSVWLDEDRMSFQVGHLHWILSLLIGAWIIHRLFKKKKLTPALLATGCLFLVGWAAAFLAHPRSALIWRLIPQLGYLQFSWRFLSIVIFAFSFVVGILVKILAKKWAKIIPSFLAIVLVVFNWNYFLPEYGKLGPLKDEEKFSGLAWEKQITSGIYDYLPTTAKTAPKAPQEEVADIVEGKGEIVVASQGTDWAKFTAKIDSENALVRINILDFPEWKVFVDETETEIFIPETEEWGRIYINLSKGEHKISAKFFNTPIRSFANAASMFAWLALFSLPIWRKKVNI